MHEEKPSSSAQVAATAAITGAILGAAIAGTLAFLTSTVAIQQQAAVSQSQFVRAQRLEAYSKITEHNTQLLNAERVLLGTLDSKTVRGSRLTAQLQSVESAIGQVRLDFFGVELLGSKPVIDSVSALMEDHQKFYDRVRPVVASFVDADEGANWSVGNADDYNKRTVPSLAQHLDAFLNAARSDLGA